MILLTKELEKQLPPLHATETVKVADKVIVGKFFDPSGSYTFYILEGQKEGDDFIFWGYVTGLAEDEFGYASLNELESVRGHFGLSLEHDIYWTPKPVREVPALSKLVEEFSRYAEDI